MPTIIINPGTGPVHNATAEHAEENIKIIIRDCEQHHGLRGLGYTREPNLDDDGRFGFVITNGANSSEVEMPGIPLEQVRYTGAEGQSIWDFPRLYVSGSSWVWKYAINSIARDLGDKPEGE